MTSARSKGLFFVQRFAPAALGGLGVIFACTGVALVPQDGDNLWSSETLGSALLAVSFSAMGWLLSSRRPDHAVGWIFLIPGFFNSVNALSAEYPTYAVPKSLPAAEFLAWMAPWVWGVGAMGFPLILLLFPTGRPPTRRWSWVGWLAAAGSALIVVPQAAASWSVRTQLAETMDMDLVGGLSDPLAQLGMLLLAAGLVAATVSVVVRFRRAEGDERQQLKWLVFAGLLTVAIMLTVSPASPLQLAPPAEAFLSNIALLALPSIPIAAGIAILKYRLYDIDVVINRTLVYATLTATLASAYFATVVILQQALSPLTQESDVAVAGSTLLVAALFRPARARVQTFIDQRFYRRKYDATRTLEAFSSQLRDEIDLERLGRELVGVVQETVQPAHASLWLREPAKSGGQ